MRQSVFAIPTACLTRSSWADNAAVPAIFDSRCSDSDGDESPTLGAGINLVALLGDTEAVTLPDPSDKFRFRMKEPSPGQCSR